MARIKFYPKIIDKSKCMQKGEGTNIYPIQPHFRKVQSNYMASRFDSLVLGNTPQALASAFFLCFHTNSMSNICYSSSYNASFFIFHEYIVCMTVRRRLSWKRHKSVYPFTHEGSKLIRCMVASMDSQLFFWVCECTQLLYNVQSDGCK